MIYKPKLSSRNKSIVERYAQKWEKNEKRKKKSRSISKRKKRPVYDLEKILERIPPHKRQLIREARQEKRDQKKLIQLRNEEIQKLNKKKRRKIINGKKEAKFNRYLIFREENSEDKIYQKTPNKRKKINSSFLAPFDRFRSMSRRRQGSSFDLRKYKKGFNQRSYVMSRSGLGRQKKGEKRGNRSLLTNHSSTEHHLNTGRTLIKYPKIDKVGFGQSGRRKKNGFSTYDSRRKNMIRGKLRNRSMMTRKSKNFRMKEKKKKGEIQEESTSNENTIDWNKVVEKDDNIKTSEEDIAYFDHRYNKFSSRRTARGVDRTKDEIMIESGENINISQNNNNSKISEGRKNSKKISKKKNQMRNRKKSNLKKKIKSKIQRRKISKQSEDESERFKKDLKRIHLRRHQHEIINISIPLENLSNIENKVSSLGSSNFIVTQNTLNTLQEPKNRTTLKKKKKIYEKPKIKEMESESVLRKNSIDPELSSKKNKSMADAIKIKGKSRFKTNEKSKEKKPQEKVVNDFKLLADYEFMELQEKRKILKEKMKNSNKKILKNKLHRKKMEMLKQEEMEKLKLEKKLEKLNREKMEDLKNNRIDFSTTVVKVSKKRFRSYSPQKISPVKRFSNLDKTVKEKKNPLKEKIITEPEKTPKKYAQDLDSDNEEMDREINGISLNRQGSDPIIKSRDNLTIISSTFKLKLEDKILDDDEIFLKEKSSDNVILTRDTTQRSGYNNITIDDVERLSSESLIPSMIRINESDSDLGGKGNLNLETIDERTEGEDFKSNDFLTPSKLGQMSGRKRGWNPYKDQKKYYQIYKMIGYLKKENKMMIVEE